MTRTGEAPTPHTFAQLLQQGDHWLDAGDLPQAEQAYNRALALDAGNADPTGRSDLLNRLARVLFVRGDADGAIERLSEALGVQMSLNDPGAQAKTLINIGNVRLAQSEYQGALDSYLRADALLPPRAEWAQLKFLNVINIGKLYLDMGEPADAIHYARLALNERVIQDDVELAVTAHLNLGCAHLKTGALSEAEGHLNTAMDILKAAPNASLEASVLDSLGQLQELRGDWESALALHRQLLDVVQVIGDAEGQLDALTNIGRITAEHLEPRDALATLHGALELALRVQRPKSLRDIHHALAGAYRCLSRPDLALEHFERYHTIERELFNEDRERTVRTLTARFEVERARQDAQTQGQRRQDAEEAQARAEAQVAARTADLERAQKEVVSRLAMAAEFRDDTTGEHTWRVGLSAGLIAAELGLPQAQVEVLRVAARLHDVGKIGIPDAILLKAGRLTPLEYEEMKAHTLIGARLLAGGHSEVLGVAEQIARTHHERWDGAGYPQGLAGADIPLYGRIVAVADVFDALMQRRPYKEAWGKAEALRELAAHSGRQFDPEVVEAALRVFGREGYDQALERREGAGVDWPAGRYAVPPAVVDDVTALRGWYEQLLDERTRELEAARGEAETRAAQMHQMAFTDTLTGLPNRRAFETDLEAALAQARQGLASLTVLSLDLDGLKRTNDDLGHHMGDALLRAYALELGAALAELGQLYRMGGDEYAAILRGVGHEDRRELTSRIREATQQIHQLGFDPASASFGSAVYPDDAGSAGELLRLSDGRMYIMKRRRKKV